MCTSLKAQAANAAAAIAKNVHDTDSWIVLGVARKEAGDYVGAAAAWQYVSAIAPTNPVSFNNLGDLYMNYLHDNAKAVSNYLTEIKNFPKSLDSYRNVFQIYTTTSYTGSATAAEDILKQGIAANPKAYDLEVLLARYYKAKGRTSDADTEYQAAAANATSQNLTDMATQIKAESAQ
jgi:tetratricopeptide (TPR) repeat protein